MEIELRDDHIGVFKNALPEDLIDSYINFYKQNEKQGLVYPRQFDFHDVADTQIDLITDTFSMNVPYNSRPFIENFFKNIYPIYCKKYSILNELQKHSIYDIKIQKTIPGEGYHSWHVENSSLALRNRLMAFMVYLNDVKEGGETEFLHQKCRFKPERNTLLIWPANYTHVHRGNSPLSNDKYIITGWVEYGV